ncbi:sigma-70 family RNA polymerase sigma factor [Algoriphagus sp. C2-6-M1]|uniref:RNA polymerase sigma factor n=1 Tax=Algoriphagus persicinus TaxID=3108754 RepID=UPI002B3EA40A|nr:sigma-70 family RNA polymerase sigma factor [Algoriphagus sp. C2-6-M1]MEB2781306.1 sigma-70 family RNA polymerase sigma factor [Algoriphagus sp. C2-6-M1]
MSNSSENKLVDHLFRHQYGKMVAILSKIFGLHNLELIEDAIQDTFLNAALRWRNELPDNPGAWLTQAAKHRTIDLLRQLNATKERHEGVNETPIGEEINDYFLDHEVADSQLRMIFVACHPSFSQEEQIAFALKAISGFSMKEIAAALLQNEETIKKRLVRARKKIQTLEITLSYPYPNQIPNRISRVLHIIYLIFNEGFHSTKADELISKDLCGEAIRLCKLLLQKEKFRTGGTYALFALMCFHASRLESKMRNSEIIDLKHQDRSKWYLPLILLGNDSLQKSAEFDDRSIYHLEAAIASEHVRAVQFENTNWQCILKYYDDMYLMMPSDHVLLSKATIFLQLEKLMEAKLELGKIVPKSLSQRRYLFYGCYAEYYEKAGDIDNALQQIKLAIDFCSNNMEKDYLRKKAQSLEERL